MRIQLTILILIFALNANASDDKRMKMLFENYDKVMKQHKVELIDEVFSKKFLKDNGGKEEFVEKVKELPKMKRKMSLLKSWRKTKIDKTYFAKINEAQFIIIEEEGKLKIDGTVSDEE